MLNRQPTVIPSAGQQQGADELTARGGIDGDVGAGDHSAAVKGEGEAEAVAHLDLDAELAQGIDHRTHWTFTRPRVAVEGHRTGGEGCHGWNEAHHCSG